MLELIDPAPWMADAACVEHPEVSFFTDREIADAKAICSTCLVCEECLGYAIAHPEVTEFGVWGGTSAKERRELRSATRGGARRGRSPSGRRAAA